MSTLDKVDKVLFDIKTHLHQISIWETIRDSKEHYLKLWKEEIEAMTKEVFEYAMKNKPGLVEQKLKSIASTKKSIAIAEGGLDSYIRDAITRVKPLISKLDKEIDSAISKN